MAVELRAVLVSETFFERIGVDFNMNIQTPISRTQPNLLNNTFVPAPFLNSVGRGLNMVSGLTSAGTLTPDLGIPINNHSFASRRRSSAAISRPRACSSVWRS